MKNDRKNIKTYKEVVIELFEGILILMVIAVVLLQLSRRFALPYPSLLAVAGIAVAATPFLPNIILEPRLALAIFVTPVA